MFYLESAPSVCFYREVALYCAQATSAISITFEKSTPHVHHSSSMNQKHLLRFIKSKMKRSPNVRILANLPYNYH